MNKRIVSLAAALCIVFGLASTAIAAGSMENFAPVKTYAENFKDVPKGEWYHDNVKTSYEYGFMVGINEEGTLFAPLADIKICDIIVMASRMHRIYETGKNDLIVSGEKWYDSFVSYAVENKIIADGDFDDYEAYATRGEMAYIFANALPEAEYDEKNEIAEIPDVSEDHKYYNEILKLYKAGITCGIDTHGTFVPDSNISRSQAAAIMTRVAVKNLRIPFVQYKTVTIESDGQTVTFEAPARFDSYTENGIDYLSDPATNFIVTIDYDANDIYSGLQITDILSADAVRQLYIDNFLQSDENMLINGASVNSCSFGSVAGYKCMFSLSYEGIPIYADFYMFISGNTLFEIAFTSDANDIFLQNIESSLRVNGRGPASS